MKVVLDLKRLLNEGQITQAEYDKFSDLAEHSLGTKAFNILIGFGVIAVSGAALSLAPDAITAIVIGLFVLASGLVLSRRGLKEWLVLANICILIGTLLSAAGILIESDGSLMAFLSMTALYAVSSVIAQSALLAVLATLVLSGSIGAGTGYYHASYFIVIEEPLFTILLFTALAFALYFLSRNLTSDYQRLAMASAGTSVFLVNFGFWVGSLWGQRGEGNVVLIPDTLFAVFWALALVATAIWAWKFRLRWVLNTVTVFGGIHFYTQWFEHLGAYPTSLLLAGLTALGFAVFIRFINTHMAT